MPQSLSSAPKNTSILPGNSIVNSKGAKTENTGAQSTSTPQQQRCLSSLVLLNAAKKRHKHAQTSVQRTYICDKMSPGKSPTFQNILPDET